MIPVGGPTAMPSLWQNASRGRGKSNSVHGKGLDTPVPLVRSSQNRSSVSQGVGKEQGMRFFPLLSEGQWKYRRGTVRKARFLRSSEPHYPQTYLQNWRWKGGEVESGLVKCQSRRSGWGWQWKGLPLPLTVGTNRDLFRQFYVVKCGVVRDFLKRFVPYFFLRSSIVPSKGLFPHLAAL